VPSEDLDPVRAASLTDAALTPYQAIKSVLPRLVGGSTTVVIGAGMGGAKVGLTSSPYNMTVSTSLWGRRKELLELVEMAKRGQIKIKTTTYPIEDGEQAYADMHAGKIVGRAVVVP
jgi:propanol-preferring alcohol dehydrogenase